MTLSAIWISPQPANGSVRCSDGRKMHGQGSNCGNFTATASSNSHGSNNFDLEASCRRVSCSVFVAILKASLAALAPRRLAPRYGLVITESLARSRNDEHKIGRQSPLRLAQVWTKHLAGMYPPSPARGFSVCAPGKGRHFGYRRQCGLLCDRLRQGCDLPEEGRKDACGRRHGAADL